MTHAQAVRTSAVERYLLDEMPELERYAFEAHYFDCDECAEDVRAGTAMRAGVKAGLLDTGAVAATRPKPETAAPQRVSWRPAVIVPWAAAATLALVVAYQSTAPGPGTLHVEALRPVTLRPDSRGAVPVIALPAEGATVTLAMDVDGAPESGLLYELRTGSDLVASGRVGSPAPGTPLLLLVPVWTLTPSAQYSLAVRGAPNGPILGEYRFATAAR